MGMQKEREKPQDKESKEMYWIKNNSHNKGEVVWVSSLVILPTTDELTKIFPKVFPTIVSLI